ncbi:MAG TPA: ABC transporter permease [Bryobacteraceae bacterium]|jgi:putative ABC transport system permease protein|nr:ABC transporter permease [Bryobacteraceae bacterium]
MRRFFSRLVNLFRGPRAESEAVREIESHLALLAEDFERRGLPPDEARRAARRAYGGVEQAKELHREARSFMRVEQLLQDVRYGARNLLRTPGFTAVAVVTLALGIGASTAIFSVVNAVLLRPLAYQDSDRLVTVLHYGTGPVATANYIDWRDQSRSFAAVGGADYWSPNLTNSDPPEHLYGLKVTQNLLPLLGILPLLGRLFVAGEDQPGAEHEAILSYRLWQRRFDGDPGILGKAITLNGESYTVVGVMPAAFKFAPFWATHAELWVPDAFGDSIHDRGGNHLRVFARLKPGISLDQARAEMATITGRLERQYPATNRGVAVTPLKENVVGKIETPLLMLLGAVGFVLLITCANVSHMLLARTSDRQKEIAVRIALGAGRARVVAQFLTENLLLAAIGAAAGLLLAFGGTKALVALSPAYIPRVETVAIDAHVVLFLLAITVLTALAFGLAPAMHAAAANLSAALKEGGRGDSAGMRRNRLRSFLVASEFALAFMLLIGAGLMIRSFSALQSVDPGFNPHNVLSLVVSVAGTKEAEPYRRALFYRELLRKVGRLPGVISAGGINHLPLAGDLWSRDFVIEGRPKPRPGESPYAIYRLVMPGYFETMRLPLRGGRAIADSDDTRAPGVVIINERAARAYWPGEDPIGKRIAIGHGDETGPQTWLTVIGIVANAKQEDWAEQPYPEMYLAAFQNRDFLGESSDPIAPHIMYVTLVVRTAGNPADLSSAITRAVRSFDRSLPVSAVLTMDRAVADATAQPRFETLLLGVFAAVALMLAAIGIYGVMNYAVSRRTREIGIRMSLGASHAAVQWMVARQAVVQALVGAIAGVAGALLLARLMAKMLYGVRPTDPATFGSVAIVLGLAALLATYVPARRASRIDPMAALRSE